MEQIQHLLTEVLIKTRKYEEVLDTTCGRFNMFKMCGVNHYENTHSKILAEFLNPKGSHSLQSKFLESFIETIGDDFTIEHFNCKEATVKTEHSIVDGRIDILITDNQKKAIIIENKVYAPDQKEKIIRYDNYAKEYGNGNYQILYLTLFGQPASVQSSRGVTYTPISYKAHIIEWMEKCLSLSVRFPMVRETINQYINHLKSLTNQNMNREMIQLLGKPENIESVFIINESIDQVKDYVVTDLFLPRLTEMCKEMGLEHCSNEQNYLKQGAQFVIKNPKWNYFDLFFHFNNAGMGNFVYGIIAKIVDTNPQKHETYKELQKRLPLPVWHPVEDTMNIHTQFPEYAHWGKEAMMAIHHGKMIEIFKQTIKNLQNKIKDLDMYL